MKLESIVIWDEKELFYDTAADNPLYGLLGIFRGCFSDTGILKTQFEQAGEKNRRDVEQQFNFLCRFLMSEFGSYLFQSQNAMEAYCAEHMHDHVLYPFNRKCWGFRVLDEDYAWYIACTPWNRSRQFTVYCYNRKKLMTELAHRRGLPESCHAVLRFTGERIYIRFGADSFDSFPQYGGRMSENLAYAIGQNGLQGITVRQMAAMEGGAVYGWGTPMAVIQNYDEEGHYIPFDYMNDSNEKER